MKPNHPIIAISTLSIAALCVHGCTRASAQAINPARQSSRGIELTIYKEDFAMIRENRPMDLQSGRNNVRLQDVSKLLDPQSVTIDWAGSISPQVVSNTYDLGVANSGSLLKRFEGRNVDLIWNSQDGREGQRMSGTLEYTDGTGFAFKSDGKLYVNPNGTLVAQNEASTVTRPQLAAEVDSPSSGSATMGVSYLSRGLSWNADYTANLSDTDDSMTLECWATVTNHTGADYPEAKITLMAGEPNRITGRKEEAEDMSAQASFHRTRAGKAMGGAGAWVAQPQAVGELYAYKAPAPASIGQEQMNRVRMISSTKVPVKRDYSVRLPNFGEIYEYYGNASHRQNAQLSIAMTNDKDSGLGLPLPGGDVRVYSKDQGGQTRYVGASTLGDVPKNQHVSMTLTNVFDVYVDSRQVKVQKVDKHTVRKTEEIVVHNEKAGPINLRLVQDVYGITHLVSESHKSVKLDSNTYQRTVDVPAGGAVTVRTVIDSRY